MAFVTNPFFLVFFGGILAAYIAFRLARNAGEGQLAEIEEKPHRKFLIRRRLFSILGVLFLLVGISGLGITGLDFYLQNRSLFSIANLQRIVSPNAITATTSVAMTRSPTPASTHTPSPTRTPRQTLTLTQAAGTPEPPGEFSGQRVIGNTNYQGLNVRQDPTTKARIVARLVNGTVVFVLDEPPVEADGFTWQHIELVDGKTGWVVSRYLLEAPLEAGTARP